MNISPTHTPPIPACIFLIAATALPASSFRYWIFLVLLLYFLNPGVALVSSWQKRFSKKKEKRGPIHIHTPVPALRHTASQVPLSKELAAYHLLVSTEVLLLFLYLFKTSLFSLIFVFLLSFPHYFPEYRLGFLHMQTKPTQTQNRVMLLILTILLCGVSSSSGANRRKLYSSTRH